MDTTEKFNGLAEVYTTGRPTYADNFIADLYEKFGFSVKSILADIGSGTGKFAKQLVENGSYVYCIEPNEDMREQLVKELGQYKNSCIIEGDAANTTLSDHSVDFITVAQAFHWFDTNLFKNECKRIIKADGRVFLIWNMRDMSSDLIQESYSS
ncbi:MAG: class I SAM-dependent methyltransferase [Lachnospiraceae bacterium]|nr:class I SAM-dependent methyltransferase [Lachnospiraceae bacterium]